mmetsp:Transcript_46317/g.123004  ORF Transcript_46317/g.123004 Transcript_46317/m.123004 type:complete len:212 (-) Transcript_46317:831-1466(-)
MTIVAGWDVVCSHHSSLVANQHLDHSPICSRPELDRPVITGTEHEPASTLEADLRDELVVRKQIVYAPPSAKVPYANAVIIGCCRKHGAPRVKITAQHLFSVTSQRHDALAAAHVPHPHNATQIRRRNQRTVRVYRGCVRRTRVPFLKQELATSLNVPKPPAHVVGCGHQVLSHWVEHDTIHTVFVPFQHGHRLALAQAPQVNARICRSRG